MTLWIPSEATPCLSKSLPDPFIHQGTSGWTQGTELLTRHASNELSRPGLPCPPAHAHPTTNSALNGLDGLEGQLL